MMMLSGDNHSSVVGINYWKKHLIALLKIMVVVNSFHSTSTFS
jgi:hypothetical protein